MNIITSLIILFFILVNFKIAAQNDTMIIKFGTIAPEGSSWGKIFEEMNLELQNITQNKMKFKFYFGKDEEDLLNLLNNQQLDAISMTSVGLGKIVSQIYVFQLPMLYSSYQELDYVRENLTSRFEKYFSEKGYVLLGWEDLGYIYLFSKVPIKTQTDLQKTRFWVWTKDPTSRAFASASGREPVLLNPENVLPSLTNNEIQTVYNSPYACIAYQWHLQVKYMTDLPLANGVGGTIMNSNKFQALPDHFQSIFLKNSKKYHKRLIEKIRQDNEESLELLRNEGIQILSMPLQEKMKWRQIAVQVQNQFIGQLYDGELLNNIRDLISEYQSK